MNKSVNDLSTDGLYKLIGCNVAKFRKEAGYSQLSLSLELGNKSPSLFSSAEVYKNKRHFNFGMRKLNRKVYLIKSHSR